MIDKWAAFVNMSDWFKWRGFEDIHGLNIVTLRKPKGRRNREHKVNLNDRNHIMPTRQNMHPASIDLRITLYAMFLSHDSLGSDERFAARSLGVSSGRVIHRI
jgi:hypothetical protein